MFVCLFACISLLDIWVIFVTDLFILFFFHICFYIQCEKRFEVSGSSSGWLMIIIVGVFVSLELNML